MKLRDNFSSHYTPLSRLQKADLFFYSLYLLYRFHLPKKDLQVYLLFQGLMSVLALSSWLGEGQPPLWAWMTASFVFSVAMFLGYKILVFLSSRIVNRPSRNPKEQGA